MEGKSGLSIIFNIIAYLILCAFIALGVLAVLEYLDTQSFMNIKVYGCAGAFAAFILLKILLNIARNIKITADNTYDVLVMVERYFKSANVNTEILSRKELKEAAKKERLIKKLEEKRDVLVDTTIEEPAPKETGDRRKGAAGRSGAAPSVVSIAAPAQYTLEDWKTNLEGKVTCKKCGSPVIVLNSNLDIPVLYCATAAAKEGCDNRYITSNSFIVQFLKWYSVSFDKKVAVFNFDDFNRSVSRVVLCDGIVTFSSAEAISYAPNNGHAKRKISIDL